MLRHLLPALIRHPFARYSHAVEVPAGARLLLVSGQLGISAQDEIPDSAEAQADICFRAIAACLAEAGMSAADVVRINAYVTDRAHMAGYMAARDRFTVDPPPASTLMIVSGFTRPDFKVEVEALAAKAG
ncbi:RidA family protein [Ancylobacter sp. A5.8]|uniref:RidA family protein n=1 Tax=Ancylobacter gelatini TaxID=2919920 RepID=UPI001F4D45D3|nr:RidA family protein [Ancylobacter gelatini]MCJ8144838.1 RidA family protein [Ancylobacter gelatini]